MLFPSWRDFHSLTAIGKNIYVFGGRGDMAGPIHTNMEVYDNTLKVSLENVYWILYLRAIFALIATSLSFTISNISEFI